MLSTKKRINFWGMSCLSSINTVPKMTKFLSLPSIHLFLHVLVILAASINDIAAAAAATSDSDRVNNLPGQPSELSISQFSGYVTVEPGNGRALFYWFFEAQSLPSQKPLLLWLNGGPGCSSVGYGATSELGPFRVDTNGTALLFNKYAWNQEANLLFVESPVGVGFSYTNTSSDLSVINDVFVAEDAYNFLVNWLQRFPQYVTRDFFISGESYAGHYVPQLAELIYDRNKDTSKYPTINLKGFIVGNPETDDYYDNTGLLEYAWSHAVISDELYKKAKSACDFKLVNWSEECNGAMSTVFLTYQEIDFYNIYAPICLINGSTTLSSIVAADVKTNGRVNSYGTRRRVRIPGGYDPCYSAYAAKYFNRPDVQSALRVGRGNGPLKWEVCNNSILNTYNFTVPSVLPIYMKLIKGGLKIWVYSGDADGRVPVIGSRYCMEALGLPVKSPWRSWYHDHQVGGRILEYEGVTFVTVRGAGHLVPLNKPSEALALIHSFLTGDELPKQRY